MIYKWLDKCIKKYKESFWIHLYICAYVVDLPKDLMWISNIWIATCLILPKYPMNLKEYTSTFAQKNRRTSAAKWQQYVQIEKKKSQSWYSKNLTVKLVFKNLFTNPPSHFWPFGLEPNMCFLIHKTLKS